MTILESPSPAIRYRPEQSWMQIIHSEIISVTSIMKRNQRWNYDLEDTYNPPSHYQKINQDISLENVKQFLKLSRKRDKNHGSALPLPTETPLLSGFTLLCDILKTKQSFLYNLIQGLRDIDPSDLLEPFLQVIKSGDTTGAITGAALSSVQNFITYRILDPHHPDLCKAITNLTIAVTKCKFEATDTTSDEIVLTKILRLIRTIIQSEGGQKCVTDKGICEMIEVSFGMHFQGRINELLRRAAMDTLLVLTQCIFERLVVITKESEHRDLIKEKNGTLRLKLAEKVESVSIRESGKQGDGNDSKAFGVPAAMEFLRVLITLIDTKSVRHTDSLHRTLALNLLCRGLEVGWSSLAKWVGMGLAYGKEPDQPSIQKQPIESDFVPAAPPPVVSIGADGANYSNQGQINVNSSGLNDEKAPLLHIDQEVSLQDVSPDVPLESSNDNQIISIPTETSVARMAIGLKKLVTDDLCRQLFQLLQSQNKTINSPPNWVALNLIGLILRTLSTLFSSMNEYLIPQQDWFVNYIIQSYESGISVWNIEDWEEFNQSFPQDEKSVGGNLADKSGPVLVGQVRELFLETLLQICRCEVSFSDFYIFHDTNIDSKSHAFEKIIRFFAKYSFPDASPGGYLTSHVHQSLCFDGIMLFLRTIDERKTNSNCKPVISVTDSRDYSPLELVNAKQRKEIFLQGAEIFNASYKKGIPFFQEHGFLPNPLTPESIASFFYNSHNLNKAVIGEYIAKPAHSETLYCFANLYNFQGRRIDEAMRQFLEKFRIPGESQQIERVMEAFSKQFFKVIADDPDRKICTEEDTSVLAFSIIMLNTDQHNPQVRRRMTFNDYKRNVRGLNSGKDFDQDYLQCIYDAIKGNEIVLAEERGGELSFNYEWREILANLDSIPRLQNRDTNVYDKNMFLTIWKPILASIFYTLDNAEDSLTIEKAILAIQRCAALAVHYGLFEIFEFILSSLFKISGLSKPSASLPFEENYVEYTTGDKLPIRKKNSKPDRWLVQFGQNYRQQVAAVICFDLISHHGDAIRNGWETVVNTLCLLFLHQALPKDMLTSEHFTRTKVTVPRLLLERNSTDEDETKKESSGVFSTFVQFLSLSSEEEYNNVNDFLYEVYAFECIMNCGIEDSLAETGFLENDTLISLVKALIKCSYEQTEPNTGRKFSQSAVFLIELLFTVVMKNRDRLKIIWPDVSKHIQSIISNECPNILIERTVSCVLRLLLRLTHDDELQSNVFKPLEMVLNLSSEKIYKFCESMVAGFLAVSKTDNTLLSKHSSRWTTLFRILSISATHPEASAVSFELACELISGHPDSHIAAAHFGDCVDLLLSYSSGVFGTSSKKRGGSAPSVVEHATNVVKETGKVEAGRANMMNALDRALKAVERLYNLYTIIPKLIELSESQPERAWFEFWLPILSGLSQQCSHPSIDIRHQAIIYLQRILLSDELKLAVSQNHQNCIDCFEIVLFPMTDEICALETLDSGIGETRTRACALIAKVFLSFPQLVKSKECIAIWGRILDLMTGLIKASSKDPNLVEGVKESIKNLLLVLIADKTLSESGSEGVDPDMWKLTWEKVDSVCPDLKSLVTVSPPN